MAVRISERYSSGGMGDPRRRVNNMDGTSSRLDSDDMNLLALSTSGRTSSSSPSWREDTDDDLVESGPTATEIISTARFNILGKMQMKKSPASPGASTPPPHPSAFKNSTQHSQINSDHSRNLHQSDNVYGSRKKCESNAYSVESRKSPLLSSNNNNNNNNRNNKSPCRIDDEQSEDCPLDFSNKKPRISCNTEQQHTEPKAEAPASRLRNILSMKSPVIPENLSGTILNLSKESPNNTATTWMYPHSNNNNSNHHHHHRNKKSRSPSESESNSSCSPVPMDHHSSSEFLPSSPTQPEIRTGGISLKNGGMPPTSSPISVSTTLGHLGYPPYGVLNAPSLSPVMNQTVPSVSLPLSFETSPPLLTHHISSSATSPNLPFGSALSGSIPTSTGNSGKGRATRPFKAYPKDPMSFSAIGLYGLPLGSSQSSTEALIHQQSNAAYAEFRKQMLSQTQSSRSKRGGHRNGLDSLNGSTGDMTNCNGTGSSNEDSHSANEDCGKGSNTKSDQQMKDDAYWERRRKNNEAAKRSRDARRAKEDEIAIRAAFLEQENLKLRIELVALKNETAKLRCMLYTT